MALVVLIDDQPQRLASIQRALVDEGHGVETAHSSAGAVSAVGAASCALACVAADLQPPSSLVALLRAIRATAPHIPVVAYVTRARVPDAVLAIQQGASDYLELPSQVTALLTHIESADRAHHVDRHRNTDERRTDAHRFFVAASPAMQRTLSWAQKIGPSELPALILGETGTGKELVARAVHAHSHRSRGPFIAINCGAIPESLFEAEVFGYRKGAFTGAATEKEGLFETAHGGSIFLDEVGELRPSMQVGLLRLLEDGCVRRLGDRGERRVNVRLIAATNRRLEAEVSANRFRLDLFYRLSVATCRLSPLRERLEDLDALVARWVPELATQLRNPVVHLTSGALSVLRRYAWPGNIRELHNVLQRAVCSAHEPFVTAEDIQTAIDAASIGLSGGESLPRPDDEEMALTNALERHRWRIGQTAKSLGVSRTTLWRRLSKYHLTDRTS
jgi:DNA-binding NtrC family response regulator